ncbi:MAG: hypothetical protein A3J93_03760 [Candidatus Magasanikbacteria bacterium RIFOXYC2_FULL_42_28]|uniref:Uncharacterized protein n=1 Tax=Candidatus Magasanikbacteria bacterium RIFOXYC2_FULL_42_28 TaxID=1798704 RepID=A0A1F6NV69_9BACT|nr:MAG: hypothetical protein A3J93_03760 [Candidatus Magasanikbacteria bacterium RIFOXYC2_FULL_42_28]
MESLQLQEFFVEGGKPRQSHVLLHITEPSTPEEMSKGNFFAVCEMNNASERDIVAVQKIIEDAESEYYNLTETDGEHGLETVLKKINRERWVLTTTDGLHCAIGVIRQKEASFSFHGQPQIFLFYNNRAGSYERMDLTESGAEENDEEPPLFSQLIQGKISPNDFMFVSTPNVLRYFNGDRLQKIITARPPRQSAQHLEKVLGELRNNLSFGGIILHLTDTVATLAVGKDNPPNPNKGQSERSLKNLFSTEKRTASTLAPSLFPGLNERVQTALHGQPQNEPLRRVAPANTPTQINSTHLHSRHQSVAGREPNNSTAGIKIALAYIAKAIRLTVLGIWWFLVLIAKLIIEIGRFIMTLFFVATNFQNRRQNTLNDWRRQIQNIRLYFNQMPKITKLLFVAATLIVVIFIISIFYLNTRRLEKEQAKIFNDNLSAVTVKKDSAESALVYGDDNAALTELATAKNILDTMNCETKIQKQQCLALNEQTDELLARLRKISAANAVILSEWPDTGANRLFKIKNTLALYSSSSPSLYLYDLSTKETNLIDTGLPGFNDVAVPKENDYAVLLYNESSLAQYLPGENLVKKINSDFPGDNPKITTVVVYNRRLYSVDATSRQIYRHDSITNGFGPGQQWSKSDQDSLSDAFDLTIDGDLYLSHSSGEIGKWAGGAKQTFALQGLYPLLFSASELWTYNDINNLYILDSVGKRLIIVNKDGRLVAQIEHQDWKNPEGLIVEEANKRAFIADDGKLYQVNLP